MRTLMVLLVTGLSWGADGDWSQGLSSPEPRVRAETVRKLGCLKRDDLLGPISKAAEDPNLLVSSNAVWALSQYDTAAAAPYLAGVAGRGGMAGDMALERLLTLDRGLALTVARKLVGSRQVPDQLYAMRVMGVAGDRSDLATLRKIAAANKENLAQQGRGFGLMPPINLGRAAEAAIGMIQGRSEQ